MYNHGYNLLRKFMFYFFFFNEKLQLVTAAEDNKTSSLRW